MEDVLSSRKADNSLKILKINDENEKFKLALSSSENIENNKLKAIECENVSNKCNNTSIIKREPNRKCCRVANKTRIRQSEGYIGKVYVGNTENTVFKVKQENRRGLNSIFSWKGKTFSEVLTTIKRNNYTFSNNIDTSALLRARPIKHYRKELVTNDDTNIRCNSITVKNNIDTPGCSSLKESHMITEKIEVCKSNICAAKSKVRSIGKYINEYSYGTSNRTIFSSTAEYLQHKAKVDLCGILQTKNRDKSVSSSSRLAKLKFDTISDYGIVKYATESKYIYDRNGTKITSALAYGTKNSGYNVKDIYGDYKNCNHSKC